MNSKQNVKTPGKLLTYDTIELIAQTTLLQSSQTIISERTCHFVSTITESADYYGDRWFLKFLIQDGTVIDRTHRRGKPHISLFIIVDYMNRNFWLVILSAIFDPRTRKSLIKYLQVSRDFVEILICLRAVIIFERRRCIFFVGAIFELSCFDGAVKRVVIYVICEMRRVCSSCVLRGN